MPATGGGLFVVDKQWFMAVGSYDEQMEIWGCDNIGDVALSLSGWCIEQLKASVQEKVNSIYRIMRPTGCSDPGWSHDAIS